MGKPGFPTPPPAGGPDPQTGVWGNRVSPHPHPVGGLRPPRKTPVHSTGARNCAAVCSIAIGRINAYSAPVPRRSDTAGALACRTCLPPSPPAGGCGRAAPSRRGVGKPGFPIPPPAGGCGRLPPHAGVWGNRVSPRPLPAGGPGSRAGDGETGFPPAPAARGRAWLSSRGVGKPGFPIPPPAGGCGRSPCAGS